LQDTLDVEAIAAALEAQSEVFEVNEYGERTITVRHNRTLCAEKPLGHLLDEFSSPKDLCKVPPRRKLNGLIVECGEAALNEEGDTVVRPAQRAAAPLIAFQIF